MESTAKRPAVDVGPQRAKPGLALLLAVLSVPGSTLAWDLPAGGLWIGLPLAIAAIVLGFRARPGVAGEARSPMALVAIVLAILAIGQMIVFVALT
ncbi:MAG: hypothetical protein ABI948_00160 [Thermoleophilia bacterium]